MSNLLTVAQVAAVLQCGDDAVIRRFAKVPGVIDLGKQETRSRRRYRVLRVPKSAVEKYLTSKSGRPVQIDVPERAERRRKSEAWEDRAILNLAKAAKQNDSGDRRTLARIADRARLLVAFVPEKQWDDCAWFSDDEE
jgi:hypothetical protein